ncbi:transcriptional regulator [Actinoplanes missouriensis]|uniref:transcriptional regulator n=1 Tax=Actinoplanes missouriensis TaxID=1866 RepID=UPI0002E4480B|nr:transcriptional regulator [Actinoplanes missouriensis]
MATPGAIQLAQRLRGLREQVRLTQSELAAVFTEDGKQVSAAAVSSWERPKEPVLLPENRAEPYARLHTLTGTPRRLLPASRLSPEQEQERRQVLTELTELIDQARVGPAPADAARAASHRSWFFADGGPVVIVVPDAGLAAIGPFADEAHPNHTAAHQFADLDALIELHGHIRAENDPTLPVFFKPASKVEADDLSGHLVLIGGIGWNPVTRRLLRMLEELPVRQIDTPELTTGEIFAVGHGADERRFLPVWSEGDEQTRELEEDVALLARVPNPFNSSRTLTLCNGIHSRGVLGAVRTLTDAQVREANEAFLARRFPESVYGLLIRVPVFHGRALSPDLQDPRNILFTWPDEPAVAPKSRKDRS